MVLWIQLYLGVFAEFQMPFSRFSILLLQQKKKKNIFNFKICYVCKVVLSKTMKRWPGQWLLCFCFTPSLRLFFITLHTQATQSNTYKFISKTHANWSEKGWMKFYYSVLQVQSLFSFVMFQISTEFRILNNYGTEQTSSRLVSHMTHSGQMRSLWHVCHYDEWCEMISGHLFAIKYFQINPLKNISIHCLLFSFEYAVTENMFNR